MKGIVNLPTKEGVIVQYETQLTRYLRVQGFRCEAVFPRLTRSQDNPLLSNDTIHHWSQLIELGFPFVKGEVLRSIERSSAAVRVIPEHFLNAIDN
jgi:hypothetical protein